MFIKLIILIVFLITVLYDLWLHVLSARSEHNPVPANCEDIYDTETYLRWKQYHAEKNRFSVSKTLAGAAVFVILLLPNVFARIAEPFKEQPYLAALAVFLFYQVVSTLVNLPFEYHFTMGIEQKYGFNRTSLKTFWIDQIKTFLLESVLTGGLLCAFISLHRAFGSWILLIFVCVLFFFTLVGTFLYPVFAKLFNKFTPLEDGELKTRLTQMLERYGYRVRAILVMDASRRSTKSNAYFTGFGHMKTIVLYDTLLANFTDDEICAVFAHEMGHGLHKDTLKGQALSILNISIITFIAWIDVTFPALSASFGFDRVNYGFVLILLAQVQLALISPLVGLFTAFISRRHEFQADRQTVKEGYGQAMISGLKKIARENFADLSPDPMLVKLSYDHPPLSERISAIEQALLDGTES